MHILLDMDGVLCDFRKAACKIHQRMDIYNHWPEGQSNIAKVLGMCDRKFWEPIDRSPTFWLTVEPTPWFDELIHLVQDFGTFTIVTNPSNRAGAAANKITWLHAYLGHNFCDYFIGHQKYLMAKHGILIDDSHLNFLKFKMAGGNGILFPDITNHLYHIQEPLLFVYQQLKVLQCSS